MSPQDIIRIVHELDNASHHAVDWMSPGGICCGTFRPHGYCPRVSCANRVDYYAREFAVLAAHFYHELVAICDGTEQREGQR